jgi:hypothetical protein
MKHSRKQPSYQESADLNGYARQEGRDTMKVIQDITITEKDFLLSLSAGAVKLCILIMSELKMNNALWYHKAINNREYTPINELITRGLLKRTEEPHIFLVNPMIIRRGSVASVLAHTANLLQHTPKVNRDMIKDIRTQDLITFDQMHMLEINPG